MEGKEIEIGHTTGLRSKKEAVAKYGRNRSGVLEGAELIGGPAMGRVTNKLHFA